MTDKMREAYEAIKAEQALQRQSEALMCMFDRLEKAWELRYDEGGFDDETCYVWH